jgi:hypothetical protein
MYHRDGQKWNHRKPWPLASASALFFGLFRLILEACPVGDHGEQRHGGTTRPVHPYLPLADGLLACSHLIRQLLLCQAQVPP